MANQLLEQYTFVNDAVQFLASILRVFHFNQEEIVVSFNGGKDATAVLYLTVFALKSLESQEKISCLYFREQFPFKEAEEFMEEQKKLLNLDIETLEMDFKSGLTLKVPKLKAAIMGTRRTDPHGRFLERISVTDSKYPPLLRINPILDWTHQQVWIFLREFEIPFCQLYQMGYTYLGCQSKTTKNPTLQEGQGAWEAEEEQEQASRSTSSQTLEQN